MAPSKFEAIAAVLRFCTEAAYAPGDVCPAEQPSSGSGTCYNMPISPDTCYTWANFSCAPAGLIGNVNYAHVSTSFTGCNLYEWVVLLSWLRRLLMLKFQNISTDDCTTTDVSEWDSLGTGSYDLLCRYHLGGKVQSWKCSS